MIKTITQEKFKRLEYLKSLPQNKKVLLERKQLINEIIKINIPLAHNIVRMFTLYNYIDYQDIISYAYEGLYYAVKNYDINSNNSFSTLATISIKNCIINCIRDNSLLPQSLSILFFKAQNKVQKEYGKKYVYGDMDMLFRIIEVLRDEYNIDEKILKNIYNIGLMETSYKNSHNNEINNVYVNNPNYESNILEKEILKQYLEDNIFSKLTSNESLFIKARYGLLDDREHSIEEIMLEYGKSYSMTKKILYNGLKKIRKLDLKELKQLYYSYHLIQNILIREEDYNIELDSYDYNQSLVEDFFKKDYH